MARTCRWVPLALLLIGLPGCSALERAGQPWHRLSSEPTGQAPDPAVTSDAVIQVYGARAVGWRGVFAVHTWIAVKPAGAPAYTRYEVLGWGVQRGLPAVRVNRMGPDNQWFGARPQLYADRRGVDAEPLVARVEAAVRSYPYAETYRTWPGPNSNTFIAHIGREVPELRLRLPPTAIGKDFLPNGSLAAPSPSGTGVQLSLLGVLGVTSGWEEGVEVNVLGLVLGVDVKDPALKLPLLGRLGTL